MVGYDNIEDVISKGNFVIHSHGVSMWPMIRNGVDSIHIEAVEGRLNKFDIPVIVRDLTDEEAILTMVDANLQRERILPSEKAFAY